MNTEAFNTKQKHVFIQAYSNIIEVENVLKIITTKSISEVEVTVLGKLEDTSNHKDSLELAIQNKKLYFKKLLGLPNFFGSFRNPEIGVVYIAGALVPIFLHDVGGKPLAIMSSGPHGILRGIGVNEKQATKFLEKLKNGQLLIVLRGPKKEIDSTTSLLAHLQ